MNTRVLSHINGRCGGHVCCMVVVELIACTCAGVWLYMCAGNICLAGFCVPNIGGGNNTQCTNNDQCGAGQFNTSPVQIHHFLCL